MSDSEGKVAFASPEWVEIATEALEKLVAEHGEEGTAYSVCEAFVDGPAEFADEDGFAAWHFYVDGKNVRVSTGRESNVDIWLQGTYELALSGARVVYTPELLAEWEKNPPKRPDDPNMKVEGNVKTLPTYLSELHNILAVQTA